MNLEYVTLRMIRRLIPAKIGALLIRRNWLLKAGIETSNPGQAFENYASQLQASGVEFRGKRILIFGYGGSLGTAREFLRQGAARLFLYDKYQPLRKDQAAAEPGDIAAQSITIVPGDLAAFFTQYPDQTIDIVLSTSVLEHVTDLEREVKTLAAITAPDGMNLHFIDLRDHFFKYPFGMLCFSEKTWRRFLNPREHLNRLRLHEYQQCFRRYFRDVKCTILSSDEKAFNRALRHIRPEYRTGDVASDAATQIVCSASGPIRTAP